MYLLPVVNSLGLQKQKLGKNTLGHEFCSLEEDCNGINAVLRDEWPLSRPLTSLFGAKLITSKTPNQISLETSALRNEYLQDKTQFLIKPLAFWNFA